MIILKGILISVNLEILDVCDMFSNWIKLVVGDSQEVCNYFSPDSTL
jgi:hypothetical protein